MKLVGLLGGCQGILDRVFKQKFLGEVFIIFFKIEHTIEISSEGFLGGFLTDFEGLSQIIICAPSPARSRPRALPGTRTWWQRRRTRSRFSKCCLDEEWRGFRRSSVARLA